MEILTNTRSKHYERPEILGILLKRVNALKNNYRQNIAIIGYQSLGKTALIFELLKRCRGNDIVPAYIGIKPQPIEQFAKNFIGVLLYQYLSCEQQQVEDDFEFLISTCKTKIPKTVNAVMQTIAAMDKQASGDETYSALLELPYILYEEGKKPVVLILDEFHHLDNMGLCNPFLELSNKIMVQKHTMYIVVSSALYAAQNILSKKLSLLFGNFETIMIHPFDNINAKRFVEKELDNFEINEGLVNFLTYFTGGYPFYLDVIIEQIKCTCLDNNTKIITEKILIESLEECMHKNHGKLNQYFQNKYHAFLSTNSNNLYPAVLLEIAGGRKKLSQISLFLNKKTYEINRLLAKLIQTDIITKKGVFHYINDPLFVHWLKYVLCRQQNSFNMDICGAADKFTTEVKKLIDKFISESQKKIEQRLKELFELFENDIVELDNKRFMLTRFDEVAISNGSNSSLINAKRLNKSWLCGIEKDYIDETKINDFLSQAKRRDCIKKILIALEGIDVNARLKALDAKVWIWDQKILNDMFFLFERPRFIK